MLYNLFEKTIKIIANMYCIGDYSLCCLWFMTGYKIEQKDENSMIFYIFQIYKIISQQNLKFVQLPMDITNIDTQLKMLHTIGFTLNTQQKLKLKLAHIRVLEQNQHLQQVKFWGKIDGLQKNYYILIGLKYNDQYEFPLKYFYWAGNDFNFKELPELLMQHEGLSEKNNILFSGDPNKIIVNLEGQGEGGEEPPQQNAEQGQPKKQQQQDDDLKKVPKKNFTQLHRLSIVVRAIDHDCSIVPKGSYRMSQKHETHPAFNFYGLNQLQALNMKSWLHFRAPQTQQGRKNIEDNMVMFGSNFLDCIDSDKPSGGWSLQLDSKRRNISVRNMIWPGYYCFHELSTNNFGSIYLGDGMKNIDIAFMI